MLHVDALLPEFDHEISTTRKLLERLPDDKFSWAPHPKSMSLARLATHLASLPWWGEMTLTRAEFDTATVPTPADAASRAEVLTLFDANAGKTRAALAGTSDVELMAPWSLKRSGQTIFSMPRAAVWRSFVLSHLVHHRGQLSVYLRLLDVPVPSIYGPSADEGAS
jgi:uncharacterized damage-inducible protein DinB